MPYGGGAVIAGQAAAAATVPAAGGYPAAAGGGVPQSCMGHATAAPVAYANSTPAVDTSTIMMGTVLPGPGQKSLGVLSSCIQPYPAISKFAVDTLDTANAGYGQIRSSKTLQPRSRL